MGLLSLLFGPGRGPKIATTDKIRKPEKARKERVEEVVNETTGKICLPPCQIACPVGEEIQRTHAMISLLPTDPEEAAKCIIQVGDEIYLKNPMFTICSYICGLCEKECNYKDHTGAVRRRMLKRLVTDYYIPYLKTKPALPKPTREKVAVIGSGPGGLMAAYMLGKRGYQVTILERDPLLGGAMRYIPKYRLPTEVLDVTIDNLLRIANAKVELGVSMGDGGKKLGDLKREGYRAVFIATGTPTPRPLTFGQDMVEGANLEGVMFGLPLLYDANEGKVAPNLFEGKRVVVVGGGNVAFDVARTARRLGGTVSLVCLECEDKSCQDGIPADVEEIEGAREEGIGITYSRGVGEIIGENGKFKGIKCPRCTSVFDDKGFNPQFDCNDATYLEGDVLLITIGQGPERAFFQQEGLLDDNGRLGVDPVTAMSDRRKGVFIGGDVKRVGFAAEAMRDGLVAAESIDRYIRGKDLKEGRAKEYEGAEAASKTEYKPQPKLVWLPANERLNFETFEKGFTIEEGIAEAKRCLYCGPCLSCKGCVLMELQPELPDVEIDEDLCSGCSICVAVCPYDALKMERKDEEAVAVLNPISCKRCGLCVSACPSGAIKMSDDLTQTVADTYAELARR